jgi:hypothetical protein
LTINGCCVNKKTQTAGVSAPRRPLTKTLDKSAMATCTISQTDPTHRSKFLCHIYDWRAWLRKNGDPFAKERFWSKVATKSTDECWLWTACLDDKGYGMFKLNGRMQKAHRVSWIFEHGDTGGLGVLHRCDNPICVNPSHLFLGTHSDNMKDCAAKRRNHMPDRLADGRYTGSGRRGYVRKKHPRNPGGIRKDGRPRRKPALMQYWGQE